MKFRLTPDDAQKIAISVIKDLKKKKYKIKIEKVLNEDAPYCTTILASSNKEHKFIEAQKKFSYHSSIKDLAHWMAKLRINGELYIATSSDCVTEFKKINDIEKDGIGILIIDENGRVTEHRKATNFSLIINPVPLLKFGKYDEKIKNAIHKFNQINRKDGLRDLCEIFEENIENLGVTLCKKGHLKKTEEEFKKLKLNDQINALSSPDNYSNSKPIIEDTLKTDLHSFRGARNLVDHKIRNKSEEMRIQKQFAERMLMGTRLISEIYALKNKIKPKAL